MDRLAASMLNAAKASASDVHSDDVRDLLTGKAWLGCVLSGQFCSGYSLTVDRQQFKDAAKLFLEGAESFLIIRRAAPQNSFKAWMYTSLSIDSK